jgi:N-hydroxyarylamine O-acetyltransferase
MTTPLDTDAYFDRIRWTGTVRHDLATLSGLLRAHMDHIPFENLDVLLGRPIRLDLESLQAKLVHARRGGYCFEHGTLLFAVLQQLGFAPERRLARVTLLAPRDEVPRTHMFLTLSLPEGRFVVDAGFGGLAAPFPLPLQAGRPPGPDQASHWMEHDGHFWTLCAEARDEVTRAWVSTLEDEGPADVEMGNHFVSTYPGSAFRQRIMLRALTPEGRVTVMNDEATLWRGDVPEHLKLANRAALHDLLRQYFGIDLPEVAQLRVPMIPQWN